MGKLRDIEYDAAYSFLRLKEKYPFPVDDLSQIALMCDKKAELKFKNGDWKATLSD